MLVCNGVNDMIKSQKIHSSPNKQPTSKIKSVL